MPDFMTIPEIIAAARMNLPRILWDHTSGGAETETTLRRNRAAMGRYAFRPRILQGSTRRSTATDFLGFPLTAPVMLAPVGTSLGRIHPDGALASARVAGEFGTVSFVSIAAEPPLEQVMAGATGPMVFQLSVLHVAGDRDWLGSMIRRIEGAGYSGICLTVDNAVYGRRDRDVHNRFFPRESMNPPNLAGFVPRSDFRDNFTWEDVDWIRSRTKLPLILKGVLTPEDARMAVDHGMDAVYVSNHGGRQLDHLPATLDVLAAVTREVADRVPVVVDSGFLRGADVLKALALGARAVLVGKLQCWGLAADGESGLRQALELMQSEMDSAMGNLGVSSPEQVTRDFLFENPTPVAPDLDLEYGRALGH